MFVWSSQFIDMFVKQALTIWYCTLHVSWCSCKIYFVPFWTPDLVTMCYIFGSILWFFKCFVHFNAKSKHLLVLLTYRVSNPDISRAAEYSTYMSPRIIFRAVFCILSCLLLCSIVRLEWNTTEQYSARLRIYNTYTSIRSSIATPTYFSLVSICKKKKNWLIKLSYVYLRIKYPQKGKIEKSIQTTFHYILFLLYVLLLYFPFFFVLNICYSTRCFINFFLKKMFIHKHCNFAFLKRLPHSMSVTAYGVS